MLTIKTWLEGIGLKQPINECPPWPPDLYALAGTLIRRSGTYLKVFEHRSPPGFLTGIKEVGRSWRQNIEDIQGEVVTVGDLQIARVPAVLEAWDTLINASGTSISDIGSAEKLAEALIR